MSDLGPRVLLIEDSTAQALELKALMEGEGMQVTWSADGAEGLRLTQALIPDLVVLDVQLPSMNGFQVCQNLKENRGTAAIPIIFLTRHDDPEAIRLGLQSGAIHYIPKDAFANAVLLETISQIGLLG